MSLPAKPLFADADQLLVGGHVLSALEVGRYPMRAEDYFDISVWMRDLLERLDTTILLRLRHEGRTALRVVAENALHDRGEVDWVMDRSARVRAEAIWRGLRGKLQAGPSH